MNEEMKTKFVFITYATPTKFSKITGVDHLSKLLESLSHLQCASASVIIPKSMTNVSNSSGCTSVAICFPFRTFSLLHLMNYYKDLYSFFICATWSQVLEAGEALQRGRVKEWHEKSFCCDHSTKRVCSVPHR